MIGKSFHTECGDIKYWISKSASDKGPELVFLPGLTADHRLFEKQLRYFNGKYRLFVWDAPGHAASYPFRMSFSLEDKARWLNGILEKEGFQNPIIIGQSMGGYVGQMYSQLFPDSLKGFISIDSAPLKREYMTSAELWLLKRMEPVYRYYPWKALVRTGSKGVAVSRYGRQLMRKMMMTYEGDQERYARLSGHGFRILAEAVEADLPYEISCPALLICGEKDHAGSCIRYNKAWHRKSGIPICWIKGAGHNSNTDEPEQINSLISRMVQNRPGGRSPGRSGGPSPRSPRSISINQTKEMLWTVCDRVILEKERLTQLDGPIGDGDHGLGMSRGMMKAKSALADSDPDGIGDLFFLMGRTLISTMGGSSGVIFGTMFMGAGIGNEKKEELDCQTFTMMMRRALEAVKERGKAHPGEKTMVDALEPAVVAMEGLETDDLTCLLDSASEAAAQGADSTKDMISKHGHSKTLGARAIGHPDPGAVSVAVIFQAMADYLGTIRGRS